MDTRDARTYTVHYLLCDGNGWDETCVDVAAGTEEVQDAQAWTMAEQIVRESAEVYDDCDGTGARLDVSYYIEDNDYSWEDCPRSVTVDVAPDHHRLIRDAGGDVNCAHEWSREGHGGCDENPGVWSTGGTGLSVREHCDHCGLQRSTAYTGSQYNPGESDRVRYWVEGEEISQ